MARPRGTNPKGKCEGCDEADHPPLGGVEGARVSGGCAVEVVHVHGILRGVVALGLLVLTESCLSVLCRGERLQTHADRGQTKGLNPMLRFEWVINSSSP